MGLCKPSCNHLPLQPKKRSYLTTKMILQNMFIYSSIFIINSRNCSLTCTLVDLEYLSNTIILYRNYGKIQVQCTHPFSALDSFLCRTILYLPMCSGGRVSKYPASCILREQQIIHMIHCGIIIIYSGFNVGGFRGLPLPTNLCPHECITK